MTRRLVAPAVVSATVLAIGITLAGASPAVAGVSTGKDSGGDARGKGLTAAERRALDIVSIEVTGAGNLGTFVTATFRGNFEKAIGHGHLKQAAAALVLRPKPGAGTTAGVITEGPGKIGRVFRHTKSTDAGAYRDGKTVTFFVLGPGFDKLKSVAVETVRNGGRLTARAADNTPYVGQRLWDRFITLHPIDLHVQVGDPSGLTCPELKDLVDSIDADLDDPYFSQNVSFAVVRALHKFRSTVRKLLDKCGSPSVPTIGATFAWSRFSPNEVAGAGRFTGPNKNLSAVRIVLPEQFNITNHLCPSQLPTATIDHNTITCGGGILATGQNFTLNLQTSPVPPNAIGGQLFGQVDGNFAGPFDITGP